MSKYFFCSLAWLLLAGSMQAQIHVYNAAEPDSLPAKILHAEPLYIDLIRDLGAHKGEKEWNVGLGIIDNMDFDRYEALVEYEWAPIHRLGLEVEIPFSFYAPNARDTGRDVPSDRIESLKMAAQWSFLVAPKARTTLALGMIHEWEFADLRGFEWRRPIHGLVFNPFFIAAKAWGQGFHSLVYTGPTYHHDVMHNHHKWSYELNSNVHYMLPGSRNFIGVEANKTWSGRGFDMTLRPQMRLSLADNLLVGIVGGIPVSRENQRLSSFIRLIYEPSHSHR